MSSTHSDVAHPEHGPTIAIVGNDVLLAVRPASAVQLAHACQRLGWDLAVPASWGDELLAAACLEECAKRGQQPVVFSACPRVAARLTARGAELAPFVVSLVAPPVAVARYLRALSPVPPRLVYLGGCPDAADAAEIDEAIPSDELFARLDDAGIDLAEMPAVFEGVLPPDRRRTFSLPGGAPSAECLWRATVPRLLAEIDGPDYAAELAQHLLSGDVVLADLAPRLGCECSGAVGALPPRAARAAVSALEPPRSPTCAVDTSVRIDLRAPLRAAPVVAPISVPVAIERGRTGTGRHAPRITPSEAEAVRVAQLADMPARDARSEGRGEGRPAPRGEARPALPPGRAEPRSGGRIRSPALGVPRYAGSTPPVARTGEARPLPRAYVGHRRPGARRSGEMAAVTDPLDHALPARSHDAPVEPAVERAASRAEEPGVEREQPIAGRGTASSGSPADVVAPGSRPVIEEDSAPRILDAERTAELVRAAIARQAAETGELTRVVPRFSSGAEGPTGARLLGAFGRGWRRWTHGRRGAAAIVAAIGIVAFAASLSARRTGAADDARRVPADTLVRHESDGDVHVPAAVPAPPRRASSGGATARGRGAAAPTPRTAPAVTPRRRSAAPSRAATPPAPARLAPAVRAESTAGTAASATAPAPAPAPVRTAEEARRDSLASARARELDDIRQELARRQRRIDSLARVVDSMPAKRPPE